MKIVLILIPTLFLHGCLYVNDRGIDTHYYNQCKEVYDSMGNYHKVCDENIVEFDDIKEGSKTIIRKTMEAATPQQ